MFASLLALVLAAPAVPCERSACRVSGGNAAGSGVVVSSVNGVSRVLTNRHVVQATGSAPEVYCWGERVKGKVVAISYTCDLALVAVRASWPAAKLAETPPGNGTAIAQFGYPYYADRLWRKQGQWTGDGTSNIRTISGESGSGVFADGRLVGVTHGYLTYQPEVGLHVPLDDVRAFLNAPHAMPSPPARIVPRMTPPLIRGGT